MAEIKDEIQEIMDPKIPVFFVLKKGTIIKNIILNTPPPEPGKATCDPILIGRHPDCHIVLEHPSISRFHLKIQAEPMSQKLSVMDLSSVHGSWVSGKRVPPNVSVDLVEGDLLGLGGSTRMYRLRWVSLTGPFDEENKMETVIEEKEDTHQGENLISAPPQVIESMKLSSSDESSPFPLERGIQSEESESSSLLRVEKCEAAKDFSAVQVALEREIEPRLLQLGKKVVCSSLAKRRCKNVSFLQIPTGRNKAGMGEEEGEEEEEDYDSEKESQTELESSSLNHVAVLSEEDEVFPSDKENWTPGTPRDVKAHITKNGRESTALEKKSLTVKNSSGSKPNKSLMELQASSSLIDEEEDMFQNDCENWTPEFVRDLKSEVCISMNYVKNHNEDASVSEKDSLGLRISLHQENIFHSDSENWTPEVTGDLKSDLPNFDKEEDSSSSEEHSLMKPQISPFSSIIPLNEKEINVHIDREDFIPERPKEPKLKNLFSFAREEEFASDKENFVLEINSSRRLQQSHINLKELPSMAIVNSSFEEELLVLDKKASRSEVSGGPKSRICMKSRKEEAIFPSNKRNLIPGVSETSSSTNSSSEIQARIQRETTRKRIDRNPFQLLRDSNSDYEQKMQWNKPTDQAAYKLQGEKEWNIVVDTDCFLIEESRRALQLMEGLNGTRLIIPRMVIRELDNLKRQESWFQKRPKMASSALHWIEKTMVKASWWIHVQRSSETMLVIPTPPASPRGSTELGNHFSTYGSLMEIVSPTEEDRILDTALLFKRIITNGEIVLLSNSIALKIKAMAEGLACETPKEFGDSLVNPYSKRFLWSKSSPRGSTWSSSDQMGLSDNYYHRSRDARCTAKGLKLILNLR